MRAPDCVGPYDYRKRKILMSTPSLNASGMKRPAESLDAPAAKKQKLNPSDLDEKIEAKHAEYLSLMTGLDVDQDVGYGSMSDALRHAAELTLGGNGKKRLVALLVSRLLFLNRYEAAEKILNGTGLKVLHLDIDPNWVPVDEKAFKAAICNLKIERVTLALDQRPAPLNNAPATTQGCLALCEAIGANPSLKHIELSGSPSPAMLQALVSQNENTAIEGLSVSLAPAAEAVLIEQLKPVAVWAKKCPCLRSFALKVHGVPASKMKSEVLVPLQGHPKLESMALDWHPGAAYQIGDGYMPLHILQFSAQCTALKHVSFESGVEKQDACNMLKGFQSICLDLGQSQVETCKELMRSCKLETLELSTCVLMPPIATAIFEGLAGSEHLKQFSTKSAQLSINDVDGVNAALEANKSLIHSVGDLDMESEIDWFEPQAYYFQSSQGAFFYVANDQLDNIFSYREWKLGGCNDPDVQAEFAESGLSQKAANVTEKFFTVGARNKVTQNQAVLNGIGHLLSESYNAVPHGPAEMQAPGPALLRDAAARQIAMYVFGSGRVEANLSDAAPAQRTQKYQGGTNDVVVAATTVTGGNEEGDCGIQGASTTVDFGKQIEAERDALKRRQEQDNVDDLLERIESGRAAAPHMLQASTFAFLSSLAQTSGNPFFGASVNEPDESGANAYLMFALNAWNPGTLNLLLAAGAMDFGSHALARAETMCQVHPENPEAQQMLQRLRAHEAARQSYTSFQ
jgi:hypothetical protein